jgi:regulator of nucleoside diphosphate kinase
MFKRKTTITRPDRDRLIEVTRAKGNTLRWAMFIDDLQRELDRARVVDPSRVSRDVVTMDSTVRFLDLRNDRREVYTLVYPDEADLSAGKLSVLSLLGTALLGARAGDVVSVHGAAGPRAIKIESILHQPEAHQRSQPCSASKLVLAEYAAGSTNERND